MIYGGTFNPIHNAHVEIVRFLAVREDVKRVLVIPTFVPPHKDCPDLASGEIRLELCRAALEGIEKVEVSDIELKRREKSYTVDTLRALKDQNPQAELALCCGGDMIATLHLWYAYREILKLAEILAVRRIGSEDFSDGVARIRRDGGQVEILPLEVPALSSSALRADRALLKRTVPAKVWDLIERYHLYEVE